MKNPKAPKLVTVTIFTTITVVFWVFFTVYNILTSKPPVEIDPNLLIPLDPTLDTTTLSTLSDRKYYEEGEVLSGPFAIQTESNEPTPTAATVSASTPTPIPTFELTSPTISTSPGSTE